MKLKAIYRCRACGFDASKWSGQCPGCAAWNTFDEEVVNAGREPSPAAKPLAAFPCGIVELAKAPGQALERIPTGIGEFDRMLGGGLLPGQVLLLAGTPGIGKSTLMLQACASLSRSHGVLYASGEESLSQVGDRARRLGAASAGVVLAAETDLERILEAAGRMRAGVVVVDSIQTVSRADLGAAPGSVAQVRECACELLRSAKASGAVLFLLGHVTKDGAVAGPMILSHLVDTVLQFDSEDRGELRVLRAEKNRFGPTSEIGLFEMTEAGLKGVEDASAFFVDRAHLRPAPGRALSATMEGSRPILVEVQALVTPTRCPIARRTATGLDVNRLFTLIASVEKHLRMRLDSYDVFVNIAGGLRVKDPGLDLAVCLAIVSSARDRPLGLDRAFVGEVGLLGSLGRCGTLGRRLREIERAGFSEALADARSVAELGESGARPKLRLLGASDIAEAVALALPSNEEGE